MRKAGGKVLGWRWRSNPLRRHSDVVEAWIVLAAWTVATTGAVAGGIAAAQAAQHVVDADRADRRPVSAVLVRTVPGSGREGVTGLRHDPGGAAGGWAGGGQRQAARPPG